MRSTPPLYHKFRKDVNGLRAIAVLAVLLFHLCAYLKATFPSVALFSGGYIGVDIFFVISGFLMTAIIVRGLHAGTFSVWDFWKRRAARICPALMVLVVVVLAVGFLIQLPYVYRETNRESMRALLFISNFWFARDQGYFAEAVVNKTLLHTWSLSVEWQFYLIYPLLLLAWGKLCSLRTIPHFIGALFLASFITSLVLTSDQSYFMLHTRAWELLLGGIVFMLPPPKFKPALTRGLEVAALGVILLNMALAQPMAGWEAWQVLPGTVACAFLLWLNVEHSLLSHALLQYTGKISYSMYLIHWPVIAICSKLGLLHYFLPILGFILVYSILSYNFIETKRRWHWVTLLVYVLIIGAAQLGIRREGITPFNANAPTGTQSYHEVYYGGRDVPEFGAIYRGTTPGQPELLVIGDSYARQFANFLNHKQIPFVGVFSDGQMHFEGAFVDPIFKHQSEAEYQRYYDNYRAILEQNDTRTVLLAHNWANYLIYHKDFVNGYRPFPEEVEARRTATLAGILDLVDRYPDKDFYVMGQTVADPRTGEDCLVLKHSSHDLLKSVFGDLECPLFAAPDFSKVNKIKAWLWQLEGQRPNLHLIDPNPALCQGGTCRFVTDDYLLLFSDGAHLSLSGAAVIGAYLLQQIEPTQR